MSVSNDFIELHSLVDGKRFCVRAECIVAVYEDDERHEDYGVKPACSVVVYSGGDHIDVIESYDEIMEMIWKSEL